MCLDPIPPWTSDTERCKGFFIAYFGATEGAAYVDAKKGFESGFRNFVDGARIEALKTTALAPVVVAPAAQRPGLTHLAICVGSERLVEEIPQRIREEGYQVSDAPRRTGTGYYESMVLDPEAIESR